MIRLFRPKKPTDPMAPVVELARVLTERAKDRKDMQALRRIQNSVETLRREALKPAVRG